MRVSFLCLNTLCIYNRMIQLARLIQNKKKRRKKLLKKIGGGGKKKNN